MVGHGSQLAINVGNEVKHVLGHAQGDEVIGSPE